MAALVTASKTMDDPCVSRRRSVSVHPRSRPVPSSVTWLICLPTISPRSAAWRVTVTATRVVRAVTMPSPTRLPGPVPFQVPTQDAGRAFPAAVGEEEAEAGAVVAVVRPLPPAASSPPSGQASAVTTAAVNTAPAATVAVHARADGRPGAEPAPDGARGTGPGAGLDGRAGGGPYAIGETYAVGETYAGGGPNPVHG
ncbi:hypothetical protein FNH08_43310, partial [Streptomyces spongiae]|nr:hypothetical protein [Streptomyces spongiae]